ncbi:unnamed protein product [Linum trigynum]|uniref:Uncharacterized protein n=1 Tax=Linum trigynum TaxID=586398 RepID=A0AAV2ERP8_9ROSI
MIFVSYKSVPHRCAQCGIFRRDVGHGDECRSLDVLQDRELVVAGQVDLEALQVQWAPKPAEATSEADKSSSNEAVPASSSAGNTEMASPMVTQSAVAQTRPQTVGDRAKEVVDDEGFQLVVRKNNQSFAGGALGFVNR